MDLSITMASAALTFSKVVIVRRWLYIRLICAICRLQGWIRSGHVCVIWSWLYFDLVVDLWLFVRSIARDINYKTWINFL